MTSVTVAPLSTDCPATGKVLITVPGVTLALDCSRRCDLSPTRPKAAVASPTLWPTTRGTEILTGTATITMTVAPLSTNAPAEGEVPITRPGGIVSLGSSCRCDLKPARLNAAMALAPG
jgi:hypothetical protein